MAGRHATETYVDEAVSNATTHRGALLEITSPQPMADGSHTTISWDAAVYDTDGFWSASDPENFLIPSGVASVRLTGHWQLSGAPGTLFVRIREGGTDRPGHPFLWTPEGAQRGSVAGSWIPVTEGQTYRMQIQQNSGGSLDAQSPLTAFSLEAR